MKTFRFLTLAFVLALCAAQAGCNSAASNLGSGLTDIGAVASGASNELAVHARGLSDAADGIDRAKSASDTRSYSASVRVIAAKLVELGEAIRERIVVPLIAAAENAGRLEAELAHEQSERAKDAKRAADELARVKRDGAEKLAKAERRAAEAEASIGNWIMWILAGAATATVIAGVVVFKSSWVIALGLSMFGGAALLAAYAKLIASSWFLPGAGAVLVIAGVGAVVAWRRGWLTFPELNTGAKLLREAVEAAKDGDLQLAADLLMQGVAALRVDTHFSAGWRKAGGE